MKLFNDKPINTERQKELDWARTLAVLFMVIVHVLIYLPGTSTSNSYTIIVYFLGSPTAAPIFMMLLGAGIVYSRNNTPQKLAKRGLWLFILHYILNMARFGIPALIMFTRTQDGVYWDYFVGLGFCIDILAFAGLTFLFFALIEKFRMRLAHIMIITLVLSCLNYLLTAPVDTAWLNPIVGLFVRSYEHSYFPFLSWIGYPVIGYAFGYVLIRCTDKKVFYKYLFAVSLLVATVMSLAALKYTFNFWYVFVGLDRGEEGYYYQDFIQYILVAGICFMWISMLYALSRMRIWVSIEKYIIRLSKNTTIIYCIHWLIIGWIHQFRLINFPETPIINLMTGIFIFIFSGLIAEVYLKTIKKYSKK